MACGPQGSKWRAGKRFLVEGDQIVLSAGAIGSPHLLLRSGVGSAEPLRRLGIQVIHDLPGVGQNLRDHPYVLCSFRATGPAELGPLSVEVILRYTAEGSMRNDMQIGPAALDSTYLPPDGPIAKVKTASCTQLCCDQYPGS